MDEMDVRARMDRIETKLAYVEDFLDRLQDQVVERGALTDRLAAEQAAIKERIIALSREMEDIPDRRPPHY